MKAPYTLFLRYLLVCAFCFASLPASQAQDSGMGDSSTNGIRLNHVQVIGSHNSYKEAIEPVLFSALSALDSTRFKSLEYEHVSLTQQLNVGLRKLELDVFYDPEGGRYASPYGLEVVKQEGGEPLEYDPDGELLQPGYKVLHIQDIDFRSNCLSLKACLTELKIWSNNNERHIPVFVTLNAKDAALPIPEAVVPLPYDSIAFSALDREIVTFLGRDKLITPDDIRGEHATIHEAIMNDGWPLLDAVRGRFMFILDEGGEKRATYIEGHPALEGRILFANAIEGTPEAAVRIVNGPVSSREYIQALVRAGYLVRTRADAGTTEARTGETERREAAFASGAHMISTDYYLLPNPFGTSYVVTLPDQQEALCNPILTNISCRLEMLALPH